MKNVKVKINQVKSHGDYVDNLGQPVTLMVEGTDRRRGIHVSVAVPTEWCDGITIGGVMTVTFEPKEQ